MVHTEDMGADPILSKANQAASPNGRKWLALEPKPNGCSTYRANSLDDLLIGPFLGMVTSLRSSILKAFQCSHGYQGLDT